MVDELAEGVESIFLGGFVTPQVRAGIGNTFPVIYGSTFVRDKSGNIVVVDNPGAWNHGFPQMGEPGVIGEASPDFILNGTTAFTYKSVSLSAVFEWNKADTCILDQMDCSTCTACPLLLKTESQPLSTTE